MVSGDVRLRFFPELVVVLALEDLAAHAGDSLDSAYALHSGILGTPGASPSGNSDPAPWMKLRPELARPLLAERGGHRRSVGVIPRSRCRSRRFRGDPAGSGVQAKNEVRGWGAVVGVPVSRRRPRVGEGAGGRVRQQG